MLQKTYLINNLDCANCAAKIEKKIATLKEIEKVSLTFTTKQLRITASDPDALLPMIKEIADTIEPGVTITKHTRIHTAPQLHKKVTEDSTIGKEVVTRKSKTNLSENFKSFFLFITIFTLIIVSELTNTSHTLPVLILFIIGYIMLGGKVLITAGKNILKGQIFDENFLMSLATIGAFIVGDYAEAVGVMLFYRVGEWIEEKAVERSRNQIMSAVDLRPEVVNLVMNDEIQVIDADKAVVGDILLVKPGERIPLDGVVIDGESRVDTSPITGEPVPIKVSIDSPVTSGCVNTSGLLRIRVEKPLAESMVTRILDSVENAAANKPKIDKFITRFSRLYTPIVVVTAILTAIIPSLITGNWSQWIYTALTFLVISCPCALVLSVPLAFFAGIGTGSKRGILFKGGASMEALANIKAIVMDKTGTITKGNFVVQKIISVSSYTESEILSFAASCEATSTHPIGISITRAAKHLDIAYPSAISMEEIAGNGIKASLSQLELICGNQKLMISQNINISSYSATNQGTEVLVSVNGILAGYLLLDDTIKEEACSAISQIKKRNLHTVMLTGDTKESAINVADKVGVETVFAKLLPNEKLTKLLEIRETNGAVMFVGDGINDAPVLAGADVGAAMGSGADAAIEAADVVFMTSNMTAIPESIAIARATAKIAKQNIVFALITKLLIIILGLTGFASMWLAVFADTGVAIICLLNSIRLLYRRNL